VTQGRHWLVALVLTLALAACGAEEEPSRWDSAQQESSQQESAEDGQVATGEVVPGSTFNPLFPRGAAEMQGYGFTYLQEQEGFAEAALSRNGSQVALLSITDTATTPEMRDKYQNSTFQIDDYPAYEAENTTSVLVVNRFEVQVVSESDSFTAEDREAFIQEFDLPALAAIK
jgi:hypothetical protein